jgi:putative membrane protein
MTRILTSVCCLALAVSAFGQKKGSEKAGGDQQFVDTAAQTDMVEANLGQLAATNADSQQVKDFAQTLVTDHTSDYAQLKTAAQQSSLNVPTSIDSAHNKAMIDPFQKLKGAAFDKKYVQEMIAGHEKAITMYKKESTEAKDPAIKSYATAALPVLQKHLDAAKELAKAKPAAKAAQ